jgi:hypothetical protein
MPAANPKPYTAPAQPRRPTGLPSHARGAADQAERSRDQAERRRRERQRRRLRRDLLEDFGLGLLLTLTALIMTAGLGVLALLEVPVIGAVIVSFGLEQRQRRARSATAGPSGSRRRGGSSRR